MIPSNSEPICFENCRNLAPYLSSHSPAARYCELASVFARVNEQPSSAALYLELLSEVIQRFGESGLEQVLGNAA